MPDSGATKLLKLNKEQSKRNFWTCMLWVRTSKIATYEKDMCRKLSRLVSSILGNLDYGINISIKYVLKFAIQPKESYPTHIPTPTHLPTPTRLAHTYPHSQPIRLMLTPWHRQEWGIEVETKSPRKPMECALQETLAQLYTRCCETMAHTEGCELSCSNPSASHVCEHRITSMNELIELFAT